MSQETQGEAQKSEQVSPSFAKAEAVIRPAYRELSEAEKNQCSAVKRLAISLWAYIDAQTDDFNGREMAMAKTHIEDAVMHAIKGLTGKRGFLPENMPQGQVMPAHTTQA